MPRRPRIAITCDFEVITDRRGQPAPRFVTPESYVTAVIAAEGVPILLPHRAPADAAELGDLYDGLLISGGDFDVPPSYYGEEPRAKLGKLCEPRSAFERALLEDAHKKGRPILGVCGGMQLLNVYFGGTLYQDASERAGTGEHTQPYDKKKPHHTIEVEADSKLGRVVGDRLEVNSTHHQILRSVGEGLRAVAHAPDGVVEAIEVDGAQFMLGVQWHPEAMGTDEQLAIYRAFVRAARGTVK